MQLFTTRVDARLTSLLLSLLSSLSLGACAATGGGDREAVIYDTASGAPTDLESLCAELADYDVVFLGEEHDNDAGHRLQLRALELLAGERGELILSLEQFEADVQGMLDLYWLGAVDEETFLENSRPWGNYREHYAPLVEFAKAHDFPVIAANIPRPLARRVSRQGLASVDEEVYAPWSVWLDEPAYREKFARAMGHDEFDEEDVGLARWYAAQCIKDDMMAQSLARIVARAEETRPREEESRPLVVHVCGKFHSDRHLGTVSRLARRRPDLELAVISMKSDRDRQRELDPEERALGEALWLVKPSR